MGIGTAATIPTGKGKERLQHLQEEVAGMNSAICTANMMPSSLGVLATAQISNPLSAIDPALSVLGMMALQEFRHSRDLTVCEIPKYPLISTMVLVLSLLERQKSPVPYHAPPFSSGESDSK